MKKFKKLLSMILAVCLVCAVSVTGWAVETTIADFGTKDTPSGYDAENEKNISAKGSLENSRTNASVL